MYKYAQTNIQLYRQLQGAGYSSDSLQQVREAYNIGCLLFSAQYRPNGKPFICHLVGTASILATHGARPRLVVAGLLHAAYVLGNFGSIWPKTTRRNRQLVRDVIGEGAEILVRRYTDFKWGAKIAERLIQETHGLDEIGRSVILMRIANELEEAITGDILFEPEMRRKVKARCLPYCSQLAEALDWHELAEEIIEVFQALPEYDVPEELVTEHPRPYLQPPLSHRARSSQELKSLYHRSPRWLRIWLRTLTSVRDG